MAPELADLAMGGEKAVEAAMPAPNGGLRASERKQAASRNKLDRIGG
jgi:hypothetical protein